MIATLYWRKHNLHGILIGLTILNVIINGCSNTNDNNIGDTSAPENPKIFINDGRAATTSTTVQLSLSCDDDKGIVEMRIADNPEFKGAYWWRYETSKTWTLSGGYGMKTVYVQFIDVDSNFSETTEASIEYIDAFTLKVSPQHSQISIGETLDIDICAEDTVQLISAYITLSFDPSIVEVMSIETSGNGFLLSEAGANVIVAKGDYDNVNGTIVVAVLGQKQGFTGATGNGYLARIRFKGKYHGDSPVKYVKLLEKDLLIYRYSNNENGFEIYNTLLLDGKIEVQ